MQFPFVFNRILGNGLTINAKIIEAVQVVLIGFQRQLLHFEFL
jgi:hypothetical protein